MSILWQNVVVTAAAVGAAAWLVRDIRRRRAAKAGCDKCALMNAATAATSRPANALPSLDPTSRRRSTPSAR